MTVGAILRAVPLFLMVAIETCTGKDCGPLGIEVAAPPFFVFIPLLVFDTLGSGRLMLHHFCPLDVFWGSFFFSAR